MELGVYDPNATDFELIPAGIYKVRLDNIEITDKQPQYVEEGRDAKQWKWSWSINTGEHAGKTFKAWSNRTIQPRSTAKPWVEGLLGRLLVEGEKLDADQILGKEMDVYLGVHTTEAGKEVNRIRDVVNGPKPAAASAPKPAQSGPELFDDDPKPSSDELGWARRFLDAGNTICHARNWGHKELKAAIVRNFAWYKAFPTSTREQQAELLGYVESFAMQPDAYDDEGLLGF